MAALSDNFTKNSNTQTVNKTAANDLGDQQQTTEERMKKR